MIRNERKGFTLIEILIVVAIIAILASVVLVGLGPTQRAGRDARRISDLRSIQTGLELYYNRCGYYPGTANCASNAAAANFAAVVTALTGTTGLGVSNVPNDPNTSATYLYGGSGAASNSYTLGATLEDTNNSALKSDIDGTSNGVNCGVAATDTVYCVTL